MPASPFDAVLCDLDNVIRIYDPTPLARLERAAGLAEGSTARVAFAPERDRPLLTGEITKAEWVESVAAGLVACEAGRTVGLDSERARELGAALAAAPFHADEAVVGILRRVRARVPLVLVTNATVELDDDLATLGLADLAHHVVNSSRVGVAKPDPGIYEIAVSRAGVPHGRCLFIDDNLENVRAATGLGMSGVHYREAADLHEPLGFLLDG